MKQELTNEIIDKMDDNNMKALEIIRAIMKNAECEDLVVGGVDMSILLDAASDYLQKNDEIFNTVK